jgi:hypothetical protein
VISSSAAKGSSRRRNVGCTTKARANETRIFMPPDSCAGWRWAASARPTSAEASSVVARRDRLRHREFEGECGVVEDGSPREQARILKTQAIFRS